MSDGPKVINVYGHYMEQSREACASCAREARGWTYGVMQNGARDGRRSDPRVVRGVGLGAPDRALQVLWVIWLVRLLRL